MDLLDQIICGDCLEVMRQIPDDTVHLAITSPPYNLGIEYDNHDDSLAYDNYLEWMKDVWIETKRVFHSLLSCDWVSGKYSAFCVFWKTRFLEFCQSIRFLVNNNTRF